MNFSLPRARRRLKPQRTVGTPALRDRTALPFVTGATEAGQELLLDTCVYVDVMRGRTQAAVDHLVQTCIVNHSSAALAELTHLFGRLDPKHPGGSKTPRVLTDIVTHIPPHRLTGPTTAVYSEAGMLAGMAARAFGRTHGADLVIDALPLLQAGSTGQVLLTRDVRDFDLLQQLAPWTRFLAYR